MWQPWDKIINWVIWLYYRIQDALPLNYWLITAALAPPSFPSLAVRKSAWGEAGNKATAALALPSFPSLAVWKSAWGEPGNEATAAYSHQILMPVCIRDGIIIICLTHTNVQESMEKPCSCMQLIKKTTYFLLQVTRESVSGTTSHVHCV